MRLYTVLLSAGLLGRWGYLKLPPALQILENPWIVGISGVLFLIEFLADKIPAIDSAWDSIQTFIRIPAGALLAALALGEHDPAWMMAAGLIGGAITAGTHIAKAGSRAIINTSPEPFSNIAVSLGEEALIASGLWTAFFRPEIFLGGLAFFVVLMIWMLPKLYRGMRGIFNRSSGLPGQRQDKD